MEIILKETIEHVGQVGDVVKVKPGFARNYLLPQNKAVIADQATLSQLEQDRATIDARRAKQQQESEALAKKITGAVIIIAQRVGEENKLFGSVTASDIAVKLAEMGIAVDKKTILLSDPIRSVGESMVPVKVGYQMTADVTVKVVPLESEE